MINLSNVASKAGITDPQISLRSLAQKFQVDSLKSLDAAVDIAIEYKRRGENSSTSALGAPVDDVTEISSGTYKRSYEFGNIIKLLDMPVPTTESIYMADLFIAAMQCFGTEDEGGLFDGGEGIDEPYVIITTINPAHFWLDKNEAAVAKVWVSNIFEGIKKGDIFGQDLEVFRDVIIGRHGIFLKIALFDHEHGDAEALRKEIEEKAQKVAKEAINVASALLGINIDEALSDQAMESETLKILQDITLDLLVGFLKDDKIDEKTWLINGTMLKDWVDNSFTQHSDIQYPGMPASIKTNFPRDDIFNNTWLFSGKGGSYKIYLRVIPHLDCVIFEGNTCKSART